MALKLSSLFGGNAAVAAGAAGLSAVVVAAVTGYSIWQGSRQPEAPAPQSEPSIASVEAQDPQTEPQAPTPATQEPVAASQADPALNDEAAPTPPEVVQTAPELIPPVAPRFDLVRVEADGSAIIAGQTSALATVTMRLDGDPIEVLRADTGGAFVALLSLDPSESPRLLSLEAALEGGTPVPGSETVIIAPFGAPGRAEAPAPAQVADPPLEEPDSPAQVAMAADPDEAVAQPQEIVSAASPEQATEPSAELRVERPGNSDATAPPAIVPDGDGALALDQVADLPEITAGTLPDAVTEPLPEDTTVAEAPSVQSAPATAPVPPAPLQPDAIAAVEAPAASPEPVAPRAPAVLLAGADGVRVIQAPGGAPQAQTSVQIDAISYDVAGEVTLTGRGPAESDLRILLNNQPIQMGEIGPGGDWSLTLPDVDPGTYTLSVQQLAASGAVTATVTTPFLREDPARIAASPMLVADGASVITVQPGFTLWGIARTNFGEGILYVSIFEQNRDQIRDPDLIFPGQIFALPDLPRVQSEE